MRRAGHSTIRIWLAFTCIRSLSGWEFPKQVCMVSVIGMRVNMILLGVPVAVRRERLRYAQFTTTLRYTHALSEDHKRVAMH